MGVSCDAFREIGKRSSCFVILSSALWPALFMPYVRAIPHFRPLSSHFMCRILLKSLDGWLYVFLATVSIRSCAYKQTQRMQKVVRGADAWKEHVPFLHFLLNNQKPLTIYLFFFWKNTQQKSLPFLKTWNCLLSLCSNFTTMQRGMDRSCLRYLIYYRGRLFSLFLSFFFLSSNYIYFILLASICIWYAHVYWPSYIYPLLPYSNTLFTNILCRYNFIYQWAPWSIFVYNDQATCFFLSNLHGLVG